MTKSQQRGHYFKSTCATHFRYIKKYLTIVGIGMVFLLGMLSLPTSAHANASDGAFQIMLKGNLASSHLTTSKPTKTYAKSAIFATIAGQYPNITLQMDLTETVATNGVTSSLVGTAIINDSTGQKPLYLADVTGTKNKAGTYQYTLNNAKAAIGTGGTIIWQGNYSEGAKGALVGNAQGTLILPTGIGPDIAKSVWNTTVTSSSQPSPVTSSATDPTLWYITRGAGSSAYIVLIIITVLGIGISSRAFDSVVQRWRILDLHQFLTIIMLGLVALHLFTLAIDPYLPFGFIHLFWPFSELYNPLAVALGVLGMYTLVIISATSWLRQYMAYQLWRLLHYGSTLTFILLTLHGILAGTDTTTAWMIGVYVTGGVVVSALVLLRIIQEIRLRRARAAYLLQR